MTGRISRIHWLKYLTASIAFAMGAIALTLPAHAQEISVGFGDDANLTERAVQLVILLTVLSLAPSILVMVTSFTRIVVVLSLLRSAIGLQTAPPNMVMVSLALFLSAFIMMPTLQAAYDAGVQPLIDGDIEIDQAYERASEPFRDFMLSQVREKDLMLFQELSGRDAPETPEDLEMAVLIPAFMISELRRAFEIGFLLYLPFLIIDLVIASVLMSMGMMMLPPVVISLPFKLIFFVLVDGWNLVAGSLVKSFGGG
ncbi:flagellar type III secretion system pore protein FliP [Roseibium alexandrii]|uniref:flagellar type III secretion system pore protein FliP n=1 Tax=Roseibium alexandrii TaxID=388408 RepID=UPI003752A84D